MNADNIGSFFKSVTGRDAYEFDNLNDIEAEVSKAVGHDLPVEFFQSNLVHPRSVFPIISNESASIDRFLDKSFF